MYYIIGRVDKIMKRFFLVVFVLMLSFACRPSANDMTLEELERVLVAIDERMALHLGKAG